MTLRVALMGAGDISFHYQEMLGLSAEKLQEEIAQIAKALEKSEAELVVLPDKGISFEIAKKFKEFGGGKVIGTVPKSDTEIGVKHLEEFRNAKVGGKKLFDEEIDTGTWYKQDLTHGIFGDCILLLGVSLGSMGALSYAFYLYKLFGGFKAGVSASSKHIHLQARCGERVPFTVFAYKPFLKAELPFEISQYIERAGGKLHYVHNAKELEIALEALQQKEAAQKR
ncbi:MAG: hypothetical protein V1847_03920 [Candidatus Diapherotrites archaeon]